MANIVVTTSEDVEDATDGVLSLREAVEIANGTAGDDVITFASGLGAVSIDEGAIEISASGAVLIDSDRNNDGLADLVVLAGDNHHFTVLKNAEVELSGMVLAGGSGQFDTIDLNGERGEEGQLGERGFDFKDLLLCRVAQIICNSERAQPKTEFRRYVQNLGGQVQSSG